MGYIVLLVDVPGVFPPFSPNLLIGPSHMSRNYLERDEKLNKTIDPPNMIMMFSCTSFVLVEPRHEKTGFLRIQNKCAYQLPLRS